MSFSPALVRTSRDAGPVDADTVSTWGCLACRSLRPELSPWTGLNGRLFGLGDCGTQYRRSVAILVDKCFFTSQPGLSWRTHLCTHQYWRSQYPPPRRSPHHPQGPSTSSGLVSTFPPAIMTNFHDPKVVQADASAPHYFRLFHGIV
jgi:hypothetical protein